MKRRGLTPQFCSARHFSVLVFSFPNDCLETRGKRFVLHSRSPQFARTIFYAN